MRRLSVIATVGVTVAALGTALGVGLAIRPTAAAAPGPRPAILPASVRVVGVVTDSETGGEWIGLSDGRVLTFGAPLLGQAVGPAATDAVTGSGVLPIHAIVAVNGPCKGYALLGRGYARGSGAIEQYCAPGESLSILDNEGWNGREIGAWGDFGVGGVDEHLGGAVAVVAPLHGLGRWTVKWQAACYASAAWTHHCSRAASATWKTPPLADRRGITRTRSHILPPFKERLAPGDWLIIAGVSQGRGHPSLTWSFSLSVPSARPNPQVAGIAFDTATGGDWIVLAGGRVLTWHAPRVSSAALRRLFGGSLPPAAG